MNVYRVLRTKIKLHIISFYLHKKSKINGSLINQNTYMKYNYNPI